MNEFVFSPFMIPIAGMVMVCVIVAIWSSHRTNEKELAARHEMQLKEMEHQQKMKAMELELAKIQAGKTNAN